MRNLEMLGAGLEPARLSALDPKCSSTVVNDRATQTRDGQSAGDRDAANADLTPEETAKIPPMIPPGNRSPLTFEVMQEIRARAVALRDAGTLSTLLLPTLYSEFAHVDLGADEGARTATLVWLLHGTGVLEPPVRPLVVEVRPRSAWGACVARGIAPRARGAA